MDYFIFEHGVSIICQCEPLCFMPFRVPETNEWSLAGCLRTKGHEPPCSLDGPPGGFSYREVPEATGPRMVFKREFPDSPIYRATCRRCGREYAMTVTSFGREAAEAIREDGT